MSAEQSVVTAAMLAIGDELLSGRTKDRNIAYLAEFLTAIGIDLREVRIVPDETADIIAAVNALRSRYNYVFTSGGIGPTHDDITANAIAGAFDIPIDYDERVLGPMAQHYEKRGMELTPARKRMARIPAGAKLIDNPVSMAPGFQVENVLVMAGVPSIFQAMLESAAPGLKTGTKLHSVTLNCNFPEGTIGDGLAAIAQRHDAVAIGSYPRFDGKNYSTQIVVRGRDEKNVADACREIRRMLSEIKA
jgi:molybdenum cofactor synthesis domain-containing protein